MRKPKKEYFVCVNRVACVDPVRGILAHPLRDARHMATCPRCSNLKEGRCPYCNQRITLEPTPGEVLDGLLLGIRCADCMKTFCSLCIHEHFAADSKRQRLCTRVKRGKHRRSKGRSHAS